MKTNFRKFLTTITLLFVIGLSAFITVPVYADEATPEAPVSEETAEVTDQESAEEEAIPEVVHEDETIQPTSEMGTESETSDLTESVESIIESLPEDTGLVVLDEEGVVLPLVSEEAAQAVIVGDPIWCPATVKIPTPNQNGCSDSYATFALLFADSIFSGAGPAKDGIIWVESLYAGEANPVDISSALVTTTLKDFKLTINGGWNGLGTGTLNPLAPSTFTTPLIITGWNNDVTINNISIIGSNEGALYSLHVESNKNITLNNVEISTTTDGGAWLDTDTPSGTGNVTVTNSEFNDIADSKEGLRIDSKGTVTLKNVTAHNNGTGGTGIGILIYNQVADTPKSVTITNVTVSNNQNDGLIVNSKGVITVTDLTAINNGLGGSGSGAVLNNLAGTATVTLNGTNLFHSNDEFGLQIQTHGTIKINNIHAVDNGFNGANLVNNTSATPQPITLTGTNAFKFNNSSGLNIFSLGKVTLNNITANSNGNYGVFIDNNDAGANGDVVFTGTNFFNDNTSDGLSIVSTGAILLNNATANENLSYGVSLDNTASTLFKGVTLTGLNGFVGNNFNGLHILSDGVVTLNNITANGNSGNYGVYINNTTSTPAKPMAVNIVGTNMFNNNDGYGLLITSHGAVTLNNITANFNGIVNTGGNGLDVNNYTSTITPANVTLNGVNTFNGNYTGGLQIYSLGAIKANSLTVKDTLIDYGANLQNNFGTSTASITLTGTNTFTGNQSTNLAVYSFGVISLNNINASNSASNLGALIDNSLAATPKTVTLSGTNTFSGNWFSGLNLSSKGAITVNNVTASNNGTSGTGGFGASLYNNYVGSTAGVTLTGNNAFNNNYQSGLQINTFGNIKANNVTANNSIQTNSYGGVFYNNGATGSVTLTGTNTFTGNNATNLYIYSSGVITLNNITANNSVNSNGVQIDNTSSGVSSPKAVTLTGNNTFNGNNLAGLFIYTYGAIVTNNLTANGNGITGNQVGVRLENSIGTIPMPITMKGNNTFTGNYGSNLDVDSLGAITANNITASNSVNSSGASFGNSSGSASFNVILTGTNSFNANAGGGFSISSKGTITVSNITANNNAGGTGVYLGNSSTGETVTNKPITVLGYIITNNNGSTGINVESYSAITLNNVTSNNNGFWGVNIAHQLANAMTPVNLTFNGVNQVNGNVNTGVYITTLGNVTINNLTASENGFNGLRISAVDANAIGNVTLKGTNVFNGNTNVGLDINTNGTVLANNITASGSTNATGASIQNGALAIPKAVTFTGFNTFSNNNGNGLNISTYGAITLSNITANNNTSAGATLNNNQTPASNITLTGKNQFNGNTNSGLFAVSQGNITVSNLTAHNNGINGAFLENASGTSTTKVTLTGVNSFIKNTNTGLVINTLGTVTLSKITADGNGGAGALINITSGGNISLTCGSFVNNAIGVNINAAGAVVTLKGVVAAGNGTNYAFTITTLNQTHGCPLP